MLLLLNHNLQQRSIPESQERQDLTVHELFVICTTMCFNFALAPWCCTWLKKKKHLFSANQKHIIFSCIFLQFFQTYNSSKWYNLFQCLTRQSLLNGLQLKIFEYLTNSVHVTDWYSGKYNLHSQTIYTKIIKIFDQIYKLILAWLLGELLSSFLHLLPFPTKSF